MLSKSLVEEVLAARTIALAGVSRDKKKFGNYIFKELSSKGWDILPIHPVMEHHEGKRCWRDISELSGKTDTLVVSIGKRDSLKLVQDAVASGFNKFWIQQGSETDEMKEFIKASDIKAVVGECILMYAGTPGFPHNFHAWMWRMIELGAK